MQAVTSTLPFAGLSSEAVKFQCQPAIAMLRATTKLLHFAMPKIGSMDDLEELFTESVRFAMTALADNLPDRLMLCAFLGAINAHAEIGPSEHQNKVCSLIMKKVRLKGLHEAMFTALDQVMQVMWCFTGPLSREWPCTCIAQLGSIKQCCYTVLSVEPSQSSASVPCKCHRLSVS